METGEYPEKYWHCMVKTGTDKYAVVNDLSFEELLGRIVEPWLEARPFTVSGMIVRQSSAVEEIRVVRTASPRDQYVEEERARQRASGVLGGVDYDLLPFYRGTDCTYELLFSGLATQPPDADVALAERICERLRFTAAILAHRRRTSKQPFVIEDEYDVQDLLHAVLRAYLKYSVQEDPLQKVAGAHSGIVDISIEELGILIEVKYVRGPDDQKRLFNEFSQDLVLYAAWPPLKKLLFVVYNAADLRDPEALEKLGGVKEIGGKRFDTRIILA